MNPTSRARSISGRAAPRHQWIADRYELITRLGAGTTGEVWAARDKRLRRNVALKLLRIDLVDNSSEARVRFMREAMLLSKIRSPNVVELYDWGQHGRTPFIAMELCEGVDLARVLQDEGQLHAHEVCILISDIAQGLHAVHREGVVHRDLKPSNIVLCEAGGERAAKLVDFGVARPANSAMTLTGTRLLGTAHYMSPEQCLDTSQVDHRSDLWALAVIAYRALTGYMPFDGNNMTELLECILHVPFPPAQVLRPELPLSVSTFFERALCKHPDYRFGNALEMADAFNAAAAPVRSGEHRRPAFYDADVG